MNGSRITNRLKTETGVASRDLYCMLQYIMLLRVRFGKLYKCDSKINEWQCQRFPGYKFNLLTFLQKVMKWLFIS